MSPEIICSAEASSSVHRRVKLTQKHVGQDDYGLGGQVRVFWAVRRELETTTSPNLAEEWKMSGKKCHTATLPLFTLCHTQDRPLTFSARLQDYWPRRSPRRMRSYVSIELEERESGRWSGLAPHSSSATFRI